MDSAVVDTWKVVSLSPLSTAALLALAVALVVGISLALWGVRREPSAAKRWSLWVLRVLAGACALAFLLEPGLRQVQVARVRNRVAVLVDRSGSMGFPAAGSPGPTRLAEAATLLENAAPQVESLKDRFVFESYGFDPELSPVTPQSLRTQPARAGKTDLLAALHALHASEGSAARKLSGVVLLSDGADNAELAQGLTPRAKQVIEALGVPVTTIAIGHSGLKDLSIDNVKVDDFAFVRNSLTAEVEVHGRGFGGQTVQLVLKRDGHVIATKDVTFSQDEETVGAKFTFSPDQTGRFVYTVSLPVFPDEAVAENNARSFALKVIRDRVRVLLVAGRPSWDERFLRGLLKQDANVELISFYILRDTSDPQDVPDSQLSLIPFPSEEIFQTKIDTFDLIVIMNFGNEDRAIALTRFQPSLENYLQHGGAIVIVGGSHSFGDSTAHDDPFENIVPVQPAGTAELQPFKPHLTKEGARHPITQLSGGGVSAEEAWAALPALPGMNLTKAKPGATVLLEHPSRASGTTNAPLVAIWEYGRGRSMAVLTDTSWYWAFTSHVGGASSRTYERFWSNAIRWLVRDPDLAAAVVSDSPTVEPGKPVGLNVIARSADYQPEPGAQLTIELLDAHDGSIAAQASGLAGPDGTLHLELPPPAAGAYKLVGRATKDGKVLGESSDAIAVRATGSELSDARVNTELLASIASATKGTFLDNPTSLSLSSLPFVEPPMVEVGRSKDDPLWDRWSWLAVMVFIVGLEWGLRRRFGYI